MEEHTFGLDEEIILLNLRKGDTNAFNRLYQIHSRALFLRLKSLVYDQDIAEELQQDVFLKIWEHRAALDPNVSFQAVLMRTAKSISIDYYRKALRDEKLKARLMNTATELYSHLDEHIEFDETNLAINKAIAKLPPQRLKIFTMIKLEGKSYEHAAKEFGVSLSTVKDHMARAMKFLKEEILRENPEALLLLAAATLLK